MVLPDWLSAISTFSFVAFTWVVVCLPSTVNLAVPTATTEYEPTGTFSMVAV